MCDIASSATAASQAAFRGDINIAVRKKALDSLKLQGQAQAEMLEVAVKLSLAAGKGESLYLVG